MIGRLTRILRNCLVVCALTAVIGYALPRWLAGPGQSPTPTDAVVVLGGDQGYRIQRAAEIAIGQPSALFVVTGVEDGPEGVVKRQYLNWRVASLVEAGVAKERVIVEDSARNTREEALAVRLLAQKFGWTRIVVISDPPHLRRLRFTWDRVFANRGVEITIVSSRPNWWSPNLSCWLRAPCAHASSLEFIKALFTWISFDPH